MYCFPLSLAGLILSALQSLAELAKRRESEGLMAVFDTEGARIVQRTNRNNRQTGSGSASVFEDGGKTDKWEGGRKKLTETAV